MASRDAHTTHRLDRLRGVHPDLDRAVRRLVAVLLEAGHVAVITQGVRTAAQQAALYAQGRTKPGKIVTNCDGTVKKSNHQPKADGYGYAVDFAWRTADGGVTWDGPWDTLGAYAKGLGLKWGGDFKVRDKHGRLVGWPDLPHVELPERHHG